MKKMKPTIVMMLVILITAVSLVQAAKPSQSQKQELQKSFQELYALIDGAFMKKDVDDIAELLTDDFKDKGSSGIKDKVTVLKDLQEALAAAENISSRTKVLDIAQNGDEFHVKAERTVEMTVNKAPVKSTDRSLDVWVLFKTQDGHTLKLKYSETIP